MGETKPETTDRLVSQIIDCAAELQGRFGVSTAAGIFVRQILYYGELLMDQVERTERKDAA
jgi:hypothetical protein